MKRVRNVFQVLCILAVMLAFTNCQDETTTEIQQTEALQKEFPFTSSVLTKQDIAINTKLNKQMRSITGIQNDGLSKNVYNAAYDFTVYTDVVKFVESSESNQHSYTFPIERGNSVGSHLDNLVFSYDETIDDYTASIVSYHFTASQKQEFVQNGYVSTIYDVSHEAITVNAADILSKNGALPCTTTYTVYHVTPDTGETFVHSTNNEHNECEHEDTEGNTQCETYTVIEIDCPDGGSSSGLGTDDNSGNTGGPNTGGSSGGNNNNNNTTPDTNEDPEVITTPISIEDSERVRSELDEIFGEGNWEFDDHSNSEDAPSFNSREELEAYINSLSGTVSASESSSEPALQGDSVITKFSFPTTEYLNIANIEVEIVSKTENFATGQEFEVIGINSRLSGLAVLLSWEPSQHYALYTSATNGNFKRIVMTGELKRGIVYEGIDISHSENVSITMEVNRYNGSDGESSMTKN